MDTARARGALLALIGLATSPSLLAQSTPPETAETFAEALKKGEAKIYLRYRYEDVRQDGFAKDAHASTLRTTVGYTTLPYKGFSLRIEAENVAEIGNDLFNNRGAGSDFNGVTDRPVVADPALTALNQVFLRYQRGKTDLRLGRQEIVQDDSRFVGNVGWRQHHQSFDAFTLANAALDRVRFEYGFIADAHRIFGDSQPMSSHFLNVKIKAGDAGRVKLYGLLLDYDRLQDSGRSSATYGVELVGERPLGGGENKLLYELELADQGDAGDNPNRIDAGYLHASVGGKLPRLTVKLGFEELEGSAGNGQFNTPLATLHKWNGWADKFLSTPRDGLQDLYLSLAGKAGAVAWTAVYHDFGAATGGASYGEEIDLQLTYKAPWKQTFGFKAAIYDADRFATDTDKLMLWSTYTF